MSSQFERTLVCIGFASTTCVTGFGNVVVVIEIGNTKRANKIKCFISHFLGEIHPLLIPFPNHD